MGILAEAFNPTPRAEYPATSDFWYTKDPTGFVTAAGGDGLAISAEGLLRCSTVFAAVRFRGDSFAMCPPSTTLSVKGGTVNDPTHYSQLVLRNPNAWQTGNRWRHLNGVWMALWGNAYNKIISGRASFAEQLHPLHPSICKVIDQRADGTLVYEYTPVGRPMETLGQEQVLHFRDLSTDGISGVDMYRLIRNVVGIALLAEKHATTFLRKGTRISGLIVPSAPLSKEQREELRDSVNSDLGGSSNTGMLGIMPSGVELKPLSLSNRDSQFIEISDSVVGMILRFLSVPGFVIGYQGDKANTYASSKETAQEALRHCVLPMLTNIEAEEEKALLRQGDGRQIKHNMDVLLRVNTKDRYEALVRSVGGPFQTVNEARGTEDMNRLDDPRYDEVLTPSNMSGENYGTPPPDNTPPPARRTSPPGGDEEQAALLPAPVEATSGPPPLLVQYAHDNAARVVKRETAVIAAKAPKFSRDTAGWKAFVLETYAKHVDHVAEVMRISKEQAQAYCDRQSASLLAGGAEAAQAWEKEIPPQLAALALEAE